MEKLKKVLKMFADFDAHEMDEIVACFRKKNVSKSQVLLHPGDVCRDFYFVHSGCIRIFFIDKKGTDKTRYVMPDHHIGTALTSFISQKPSVELIEAVEDSVLLVISHGDFYRLNSEMNNWKFFYQRILEMAYAFQNRKIEQLVNLSARERYETVMKENPGLMQRLSNRVMASYLDMREETLSRLKSGERF